MSKKLVPLVTCLVLCAALVIVFVAARGGASGRALTAAGSSMQAATATPTAAAESAPAQAVTETVSYDPGDDQTSATIDLHAGYIMDPYLLPVVGKTEKAASDVVTGCNGFIGTAPSVVVNWSGRTDRLNIFVYSDDDAVLAVQKPDGSFICNDDAGARTVDPLLTIEDPADGPYTIYVGSANQDQPALGFLALTQAELDDARLAALDLSPMLRRRERPRVQPIPQLDLKDLLLDRTPIFGSTELQAGFEPVQHFAAGGGDTAAIRLEDQMLVCAGYLTAVPSYSFTWSGDPQDIRVYFEALKDSSLAVVTPDLEVLCGMNAATDNLNPVIDIPAAAPGQYKIYVAAMQPGTVVAGRLTITGDLEAEPAALAPGAVAPANQ
jgi:hypothetical protein